MSDAVAVAPRAGPIRRLSRGLERHSRLRLAALLAPPLSYLLILYIGSLAFLLVSAFWHFDSDITFTVTRTFTLENFAQLLNAQWSCEQSVVLPTWELCWDQLYVFRRTTAGSIIP